MSRTPKIALAGGAVLALAAAGTASADTVELMITIENLAPTNGTWLTPVWGGFHDGGFDLYDDGSAASLGLERIAEDGNASVLSGEFLGSGFGTVDGMIGGGPIAPGVVASQVFTLDSAAATSQYFSFASMILPSNDAFIGNEAADAHRIFDANGNFLGADFFVTGADVRDAGTEVNDELPENTAFFGQAAPDTGVVEGGVVGFHPGFLGSAGNPGVPSILADPNFAGADFSIDGYPVARVTISVVPAPGAIALLSVAGFLGSRRRRG